MSHITHGSAYSSLVDRLNRFPQGAPPSELLHGILAMLFSETEAQLVALLPIKPFTALAAARIWKRSEAEARAMAAILGVVLRLPPIKQAMASRQMKSRYLEYFITRLRA